MKGFIYLLISLYFGLGAMATYFTYRKREAMQRHAAWIKYWVYLIIIYGITTLLFFAPQWFPLFAGLITGIGIFELIRAGVRLPIIRNRIYVLTLAFVLFGALSTGFIFFSKMNQQYLLFAFFVVTSLDAFSQLTGQLLGRHHIFPRISQAKTLEGLILGMMLAIVTGGLAHIVTDFSFWQAILYALIISVFSLFGDLLASAYKRWCGIKDYNTLIPGHGGVLDRFDSLLAGGSAMYLIFWLLI